MKKLLLLLLLLPSLLFGQSGFMLTKGAGGGGGGGRTSHYRALTILSSSITGGANLDSFTVTFKDAGNYLKTVANGGEIASVVGGKPVDLLFCADNACAVKYKWDVESWDGTSSGGSATVKILIPTGLSFTTNTVFYVVYDSAGIGSYQGGSNPYDSKTRAAYYFNETLSGSSAQTVHDYTANGLDLTSHGTWTTGQQAAGQVGGSLAVTKSSSNYFTMASQSYTGTWTVSGWYKTPGTPDMTDNWWLSSTDESTLMGLNGVFVFTNNCSNSGTLTTFNANTWYYIVFTRNGTASLSYVNGALDDTQTTGCNVVFDGINAGFFSSSPDISQDNLDDDIVISTVVRSAGWTKAVYDDQKTGSTFIIIGAEN